MKILHRLIWLFAGLAGDPALHAGITYVDANDSNTTRWDRRAFSPTADGAAGADHNWKIRSFGNQGAVYESNAAAAGDAPMLVTTLTGLSPHTEYMLYAYFWDSSSGNWRLNASARPSDINDHATPDNPADDFLPSSPSTAFSADNTDGATKAQPASTNDFVSKPLVSEGDRTLMQAPLGTAVSDGSGRLSIYIDDLAGVDQSKRTWFDGVGYKLAGSLDSASDADRFRLVNSDEASRGPDPLHKTSVPSLPGNSIQITANGAWTWFNDERAIFHQGSLFVGYVKGDGQYGVTRYNPATRESSDMVLSTKASRQQDDHNNPSITVLPDGRLMALYSKHRSNANFYQRTSLVSLPSSDADWGPEIVQPLTNAFGAYDNTYNCTFQLRAESNRIYNFHRYINFNPTITVSDDQGATWKKSVPFIEVGTGKVRPYPRYCTNHNDRIDLIYTDGHPRDVDNSLYHMFYRGGVFRRTDGSPIDSFENLPLDHGGGQRGNTIYQFSGAAWGPGQGPDDWIPGARAWTWDIHYGPDGKPVCVFQVQTGTDATWSGSRIYYYYARWTGSAWQKRFIAQAGRGIYAAESDYGGGMCIDPKNPNVVYISSNAAKPFDLGNVNEVPLRENARFEIYRGVTNDGGFTFNWSPVTTDSEKDNLRPIVPEGSPYENTLLWFNGSYHSYSNFNCRVLAILRDPIKL